ncbi:MAG: hypothetical protein KY459_13525 [Acidobacteria bacterium]|nr:hypothetical protein [Acidobacteriota bacterium]
MSEGSDRPQAVPEASSGGHEDDFPHESLVLPAWVPLLTGLILLALLAGAIWKALN